MYNIHMREAPDASVAENMMQPKSSMSIMQDLMRIVLADTQKAVTAEQCTLHMFRYSMPIS